MDEPPRTPSPVGSLRHLFHQSDSASIKTTSSMCDVRRRDAQLKLELACLAKEQNEARRMELDKIAHLQHENAIAEDDRKIKAAEVEADIWETDADRVLEGRHSQYYPTLRGNVTSSQDIVYNETFPSKVQYVPYNVAEKEVPSERYRNPNSDPRHIQYEVNHSQDFGDRAVRGPEKLQYGSPKSESSHAQTLPYGDRYFREEDVRRREQASCSRPSHQSRLDMDGLHLPRPEIRNFEGDPMDYGAFLNRFKAHVSDSLPNSKKMTYLLQFCSENVRDQIQHYADNQRENPYCYDLAWEELHRRYGQPHIIAQTCEERLLALPTSSRIDPESLGRMSVLMNRCRSALNDVPGASSLDTVHFISLLVNKLPYSLREEWVKIAVKVADSSGRVATFRDLVQFISEQARISYSVYGLKTFLPKPNIVPPRKPRVSAFNVATAYQSHQNRSDERMDICKFCKGQHYLHFCGKFSAITYEDRWEFVRRNDLCKPCLKSGHVSRYCRSRNACKKGSCNSQSHHTLLHPPDFRKPLPRGNSPPPKNDFNGRRDGKWHRNAANTDTEGDHIEISNVHAVTSPSRSRTYLDIIPVTVFTKGRSTVTYTLLDSGSDRTFCEKELAIQLGVLSSSTRSRVALRTMTSDQPKNLEVSVINLEIGPLEDGACMSLDNVIVLDKIPVSPSPAPEAKLLRSYKHLQDVHLPRIKDDSVRLLIGNDHAAAHRCMESRFSPDPNQSPDAIRTPIGWLLRGRHLQEEAEVDHASNFLVRGLKWPSDVEDLQNLIVTDEGETFPMHADPDLYDKEEFMELLITHKEMLEFGLQYSRQDPIAYDKMRRCLSRENRHYVLPLLWRNDADMLPSSREMAMKRLVSLKRRLQRDANLYEKYVEQMEKTINKGYAELVPEEEVSATNRQWYLPHHPVFSSKKPGKVRIVYDCAAVAHNRSLNDFLMKGPDLTNSLVGVLLRFRRGAVAIISDVEAMFHQVKVARCDRDTMRFFWWPQGNLSEDPKMYRMTVHLFGAKSSPSCASFCLRETAKEYGKLFDPHVAATVLKHFYADDCLVTAETDDAAMKLVNDLRELLSKGGFRLTKWLSNSNTVMNSIPDEDKCKAAQNSLPSGSVQERVLGINWDVKSDEFYFTVDVPDEAPTKRRILSITNSLYDPLGFVAPVVLEARLIYSDVCQKGLGWDEPIDESCRRKWEAWKSSLSKLQDIRIPRWYQLKCMSKSSEVQLHFFSDASITARGAVCYMRCILPNSSIVCSLIIGKAFLPGVGRHTIPRLELEAALDTVKLARTLKQELELDDSPCVFWCDSMIVLQSLLAETKKFPIFSRNRLQRILAHTKVYDWRYVPSRLNPADQASRGSTSEALVNSGTWINGPDFLRKSPKEWPQNPLQTAPSDSIYDAYKCQLKVTALVTSTLEVNGTDKLISSFSNIYRLKLATAWLLRFKTYLLCRLKGEKMTTAGTPISAQELEVAEEELVRYEQRQAFPVWMKALSQGKLPKLVKADLLPLQRLCPILIDDTLRVGGSIDRANLSFETRHPAILDQRRHFTELVIDYYHREKSKHMGEGHTLYQLAQRYWILNAKTAIKRVLSKCITCRRRTAKPCQQIMAELPEARLQLGEAPFSQTGVDYFGPISVRVGRSDVKRYGCLFTCLTTRAIHLELAPDLTTSSFINALRRFVARRGPVKKIFSDKGSNFVGCERTLKRALEKWNQNCIHSYLRQQSIDWRFSPPTASNFGGVWERMIRTVRQILMDILPKSPLSDDVLHTLFLEIEDIVNSSPLTGITLEVDGDLPLTPNHLIRLNTSCNMAPMVTDKKDEYHRERYRKVQLLADNFWKQWVREYPRTLQPRSKWLTRNKNIRAGDIVLIIDDSAPRQHWPLGRVVNTHPDRHGDVRSVEVKTATGVYKRPINKLCIIVPSNREDDEEREDPTKNSKTQTRDS